MQMTIFTVAWDVVHSRIEKCGSAISCQVNVSLPAYTRSKEFHTMFLFSFINITHGPSCCCHPSLPGVFSKLVQWLIQNKQHIRPLSLTVLWLFVPQGSSQGWSLRAGGDLPAGGGGQPVRGPRPAGQLCLQRLAFGRPGHLPRWIPAYLKPGWRGQQRGVNPAISLWHHLSSSAVAQPQSVKPSAVILSSSSSCYYWYFWILLDGLVSLTQVSSLCEGHLFLKPHEAEHSCFLRRISKIIQLERKKIRLVWLSMKSF